MFHKKYLQIVIDNKDLFVTQNYIILDKNAKQNIILKKLFKISYYIIPNTSQFDPNKNFLIIHVKSSKIP